MEKKPDIKRSELAAQLECFTEDELLRLADIKASTAEAWRKRGTGPAYLRFGNTFLYPREEVLTFLKGKVRERFHVPAKGCL